MMVLDQGCKGCQSWLASGYRYMQARTLQDFNCQRGQRPAIQWNERLVHAHAAGAASGENEAYGIALHDTLPQNGNPVESSTGVADPRGDETFARQCHR